MSPRRPLLSSFIALAIAALTTATALAHEGPHGVPVGDSTLFALPLTLIAAAGILGAAAYFMYTAHRDHDLPLPANESPTEPIL